MTQLVIFLEEISAKEMLSGLLPKFLPAHIEPILIAFEGKQDLEKQLPIKLRGWLTPNTIFVVMRDQDSGDCVAIKRKIEQLCIASEKPDALIRIACHELEPWYLGDLNAVEQAVGPRGISSRQDKAKYRIPDDLNNPSDELKKISPNYQKISGSRDIGPLLDIDNNRSHSFNVFVSGLQRLWSSGALAT